MRVQFVLHPFDGTETFGAATSLSQSIELVDQSSDEWLSQRSRQYRNCTTVTRVLHEGTELPKDKPIQWIVNHLIASEAYRQTAATPVIRGRKPLTGWDPSSATLTLHIECSRNGRNLTPFFLIYGGSKALSEFRRDRHLCQVAEIAVGAGQSASCPVYGILINLRVAAGDGTEASVLGCAPACKPCSPGSACSEPLSPVARHYANLHFDTYWKRAPDGAPCRYTDADCWHPGVQAAVVRTMAQIRAQGVCIEAAPILAFMQEFVSNPMSCNRHLCTHHPWRQGACQSLAICTDQLGALTCVLTATYVLVNCCVHTMHEGIGAGTLIAQKCANHKSAIINSVLDAWSLWKLDT